MPVHMHYTSQLMAQKTWPSSTKDNIERLTGKRTDELAKLSQDHEAWRELVVACSELQPPD